MPWYSLLRRTLAFADEHRHLGDATFVDDLTGRGAFHNDIPGRFTHGYGFQPAEIVPFFERHGLTTITVASAHGYAAGMEDQLAAITDPVGHAAAIRILLDTAEDPSLFGTAQHLLYVGRVPA